MSRNRLHWTCPACRKAHRWTWNEEIWEHRITMVCDGGCGAESPMDLKRVQPHGNLWVALRG